MVLDPLSPVAPARVRVLLLPIGRLKRTRFLSFVSRLQQEHVVRLGDISPDGRPNRNMFSPLAFPTGMIVYDLTTSLPPPTHLALSPFELFREPLAVIGIADGTEVGNIQPKGDVSKEEFERARDRDMRKLYQELELCRDHFPRALVYRLFLFDYIPSEGAPSLLEDFVSIPPPEKSRTTTVKTVMCDFSSLVLAEMTTLAKSLQGMSSIESPSQSQKLANPTRSPYDTFLRRSSQQSVPGYDGHGGKVDKNIARMSMPVQVRPGQKPLSRSNSIGRQIPSNGHTTPTSSNGVGSPESGSPDRSNPAHLANSTDSSRISVQGFGSGSFSERSRNMGKGRVGIAVGSLYMFAGRWIDAIRELTENAFTAKANIDHLWHAKALENILVSMLMLAWTGMDFQIPQICYASADKMTQQPASGERSPASSRLVSLHNLAILLPELLDRILNLYGRAANFSGEALPQLPFSETVIRFSKLQSAIHLVDGNLNDDVLQYIVTGAPLPKIKLGTTRLTIKPTRTEIVTLLFRAFPQPGQEYLSVTDRAIILGGIASVLSILGYNRKKAMVMRELVAILIPGLVQARKLGAAEVGVHPAAGLAAVTNFNGATTGSNPLDLTEGDIECGMDVFLQLLARTYGVVSSETSINSVQEAVPTDDSDDAIIARIMQNAKVRIFGTPSLKVSILQACINLSEALPDFHGVLRFSADLLRTVGSGIAPGPKSENASPSIPREEQLRLVTNITRTVSAGSRMGLPNLYCEYWDEFLVRGIEPDLSLSQRTPIPHEKFDLEGATSVAQVKEKNPFIYNPFLKKPDHTAVKHLLVAGEVALFKVTLQNPYEFDVELESIKLETEGPEFESSIQNTIIGPYRTQILSVSGTPKESGSLKITGCIIKVRGCRERRFPVFLEPWSPKTETKMKATGLSSIETNVDRPVSTDSLPKKKQEIISVPKIYTLTLPVIDPQPVAVVHSTSLSQSALMVLQGQRITFSITLANVSKTTPVDLILFSFQDSTQAPLQAALKNKEATSTELYEYEVLYAQRQSLRWLNRDKQPYIAPGQTSTFDFDILGRPGLTSATIQIDYAHIGRPQSEVKERFYTRQVTVPLTVTVNASVELVRMDIVPLAAKSVGTLCPHVSHGLEVSDLNGDTHCLVLMDLRNSWPSALEAVIEVDDGRTIEEKVGPAETTRIMFPLKRIHLDNAFAPIPTLDPSRQRQFVVSASKISADTERSNREIFWYREELLKVIKAGWRSNTGCEWQGDIDLRAMRLNGRMIDALKIETISIEIMVKGRQARYGSSTKYNVYTDEYVDVVVRITNRSIDTIHPLLRIQPFIKNQPHSIALELSKKFVVDGVAQQTLPPLPAGESTEVTTIMTPLCRGEYEIGASVEETQLWKSPAEEKTMGTDGDATAAIDILAGVRERRIWHARQECVLVVRDE